MEERIKNCLNNIFEIGLHTSLSDIVLDRFPLWDSFNIIQMLEQFEDEFGLTLTIDELRGFITMEDVCNWAINKSK